MMPGVIVFAKTRAMEAKGFTEVERL